MSLPITSAGAPSGNMQNVIEDQPSSPSPGVRTVLQSLGLICVIHAGIVTAAGISLGSARHADHLAAYWAYTAGTSCLITLSGWRSARKGRRYTVFWRITLLFLFSVNIVSGMALLRLPGELRTGAPLRESLVFIYGIFTAGSVSLAAFALDWIYGNVTTPAGNLSETQNQVTSLLPCVKRWVDATLPIQLFSGGQDQEVSETSPSNHEMMTPSASGQAGNLQVWLSRMERTSAESTSSEEKEHLLSNVDVDHIV